MTKNKDITVHNHCVTRQLRQLRNQHNSFVVWITGLSGSGKSTLASDLEKELFDQGINTYILDGDNIRSGLNSDLDFTKEGRIENIRRIGEVAKLMIDAGIVVITAFISPFEEDRERARNIIGPENFIEVFVDTPLEVCEQRDPKGLYKKAREGKIPNFTGIDSPFEVPPHPDVVVHNHKFSREESMNQVMDVVEKKLIKVI